MRASKDERLIADRLMSPSVRTVAVTFADTPSFPRQRASEPVEPCRLLAALAAKPLTATVALSWGSAAPFDHPSVVAALGYRLQAESQALLLQLQQ